MSRLLPQLWGYGCQNCDTTSTSENQRSHNLNSLKGIYLGLYREYVIGVLQGDARTIAHMTHLNLAAAWRPHVSGFLGESGEFPRLQAEIPIFFSIVYYILVEYGRL